jgi:hypothetical protein
MRAAVSNRFALPALTAQQTNEAGSVATPRLDFTCRPERGTRRAGYAVVTGIVRCFDFSSGFGTSIVSTPLL